jgi:ATP-dependent Clp protease ATP-binding subunit ClpC
MFERYTEKARRAVFFARYEASQYGNPSIETEHLLPGLYRETAHLGSCSTRPVSGSMGSGDG